MAKNVSFEELYDIRKLYKNRDSLKSDFVQNNVAYSWMRSKLLKVQIEKGNSFYNKDVYEGEKLKSIISKEFIENHFNLDLYVIGLFDLNGNLIYKTNHDRIDFRCKNISSDYIGTNGIGLTLSNMTNTTIKSTEHYLDSFDNFYTKGILLNNESGAVGLLGIVGIIDEYDSIEMSRIDNDFKDLTIVGETGQVIENTNLGLEFYRDVLPEISKISEKFNDIAAEQPIFINGEDAELSEILARMIHDSSELRVYPFIVLRLGIDLFHKAYEVLDQLESIKGTVYIENIEKMPVNLQVNLVNNIGCKVVNNDNCNDWYLRDTRIITYSKFSIKQLRDKQLCKPSLLTRIEAVNTKLSKFTDINISCVQILKQYLQIYGKNVSEYSELLEKIEVLSEKIVSNCNTLNDVLNILSTVVYKCDIKATNIDKIVDYELEKLKRPGELNLKVIEEKAIRNALEYSNSNIYSACELLNISRSTLYRKIKEYDITL